MTGKEDNETPLVTRQDDPNMSALGKTIKSRIHEKMAHGFYDDKELSHVKKMKLAEVDAPTPVVSTEDERTELTNLYGEINDRWDTIRPIDVESPRGGIVGAITKLYKRAYRKIIQPALNISLIHQAQFNASLVRTLNKTFEALVKAEDEIKRMSVRQNGLGRRMWRLEDASEDFTARLESAEENGVDLASQVKRLTSALDDTDRQGIFLKRRIVTLLEKIENGPSANDVAVAKKEIERLDSQDYVKFENLHRGSREEIRERLKVYTTWFEGLTDLLDVGCGRGELLELFRDAGMEARGIDINETMVEKCRELGLKAETDDALLHIGKLENGSLGGVSAVQFIEHLPTEKMIEFFTLAIDKLRPGGLVVAETVNPACLATFCGAFYVDITHNKPIHPFALRFALERIGYSDVRIEYLSPYPEEIRLQPIPYTESLSGAGADLVVEYNLNVEKLNNVLFSHADYAVLARR